MLKNNELHNQSSSKQQEHQYWAQANVTTSNAPQAKYHTLSRPAPSFADTSTNNFVVQ